MSEKSENQNNATKKLRDFYGKVPEHGDLFPLVPKTDKSPDVSHVIKEIFREYLKEEVPSYDTARTMQITCQKNPTLKEYADSVVKLYDHHKRVLDDIAKVEEVMLKNHARYLLKRDKVKGNKDINTTITVKGLPLLRPLDENTLKKYPLIKSCEVFCDEELEKFGHQSPRVKAIAKYLISSNLSLPADLLKRTTEQLSPSKVMQKSQMKQVISKAVGHDRKKSEKGPKKNEQAQDAASEMPNLLSVKPGNIIFTSFATHRAYKKVLIIQNISTKKVHVRVMPLNEQSLFKVKDHGEGAVFVIAAGIPVALTVVFHCKSLDNASDKLILKVEGGKDLIIPISAQRFAPILEAPGPIGMGDMRLKSNNEQAATTLECGVILVGESVLKIIHLSNDGGDGCFWIMSEEEWTHCEIKFGSMNNVLSIPPFQLRPYFFHLKTREEITLCLFYQSDSQGLQIKHIKVICDNCMVHSLDILADAVYFESRFILFSGLKKTFPIEMDDDMFADYYFNMGHLLPNGSSQKTFFLVNESDIEFQFRWRTRDIAFQDSLNNNFYKIPPEYVTITPREGTLPPKSEKSFTLTVAFENAEVGQHRIILSFYVEKLPWQSVIRASSVRAVAVNPECVNRVDVLVNEIEVWAECVPFAILLQPHILKITNGKLRCNEEPILPKLTLTNTMLENITFNGVYISPPLSEPAAMSIINVQVTYGSVNAKTFLPCPLKVTTLSHGLLLHELRCSLNEGEKSVEMLVCAQVLEPQIYPSQFILNFGNVKRNTTISQQFKIYNGSHTEVVWVAREFKYDFENGVLKHLPECRLSVHGGSLCYKDSVCTIDYSLDTKHAEFWISVIELSVATSSRRYRQHFVLVIGDIEDVKSSLKVPPHFTAYLCPENPLFLGIPIMTSVILQNHSNIPLTYKWGMPLGEDVNNLNVLIKPCADVIHPTESTVVDMYILPMELGAVSNFYIPCFVEGERNPMVLAIKCLVQGVAVTFILPSETNEDIHSCIELGKYVQWSANDTLIFPPLSLKSIFNEDDLTINSWETFEDSEKKLQVSSVPMMSKVKHKREIGKERIIQKIDYETNNTNYSSPLLQNSHFPPEIIDVTDFIGDGKTGKLYLGADNKLILHLPLTRSIDFAPMQSYESELSESFTIMDYNDSELDYAPVHTFPLSKAEHTDESNDISSTDLDNNDEENINEFSKRTSKSLESGNELTSMSETLRRTSSIIHDGKLFIEGTDTRKSKKSLDEGIGGDICKYVPQTHIVEEITFANVKVKEVVHTKVYIKNETPVETFYDVIAHNFSPKSHIEIQDIVNCSLHDLSSEQRDKLECCLKPNCGIAVFVKQKSRRLRSHENALVDIFVYASTWGVYCEHLIFLVNGLPPYYVRLIIQVQGLPVYFCMSPPSLVAHIPLSFGTVRYLSKPRVRSLRLYNESCVTVNISWHIFMKEGRDQLHKLNKSKKYNTCGMNMCSFTKKKEFHGEEPGELSCKKCEILSKSKHKCPDKIEFGTMSQMCCEDYTHFQIQPKETTIMPRSSEILDVCFNPLMVNTEQSISHFSACIVGLMKISSNDIYVKDEFYRPSGKNLSPIIQNITADVELPYLSLETENEDFEFRIEAGCVLSQPSKEQHITRTFVIRNKCKSSITAIVNTEKPFVITDLKTKEHRQRKSKIYTQDDMIFTLLPGECAEVDILCVVKENLILKIHDTIFNAIKDKYSNDEMDNFCQKTAIIERALNLTQPSITFQTFKLKLFIEFPILTLSTEKINFGPVFIGDTKNAVLEVENKTETCVWFNVMKVYQTSEFAIKPSCGVVPPASTLHRSILRIKIYFSPSENMSYLDYLKVHTFFPGNERFVVLEGCGTMDSKFHSDP